MTVELVLDLVGETGPTGGAGADGEAGASGASGLSGLSYAYSTTTTDADPGSGVFRFDDTTIADVAAAYIDNLDANGVDVTAILDSYDDSGSTIKGFLHVYHAVDAAIFASFRVTGTVVDGTGYRKLTLTHVASNGTFVDGVNFTLQFSASGDKGDTGPTGSTGSTGAPAGVSMQWNTSTSSDPGAGKVRGNAAQASITELAIDDVDSNGVNIEALLQALDNSTSTVKGTVWIRDIADAGKWVLLQLDSVFADQTGYWTATVTVADNGGTISNDANISLLIITNGDKGDTGPAGPATVPNDAVRVTTTTNGTLATAYDNGETVDGIVLVTGDLIMIKDQSAPAENGIYDVQASGAPVRNADYDTFDEHPGKVISVQEGTANADTVWLCTSDLGGTLETTDIDFAEVSPDATESVAGLLKKASAATLNTGTDQDSAPTAASLAASKYGTAIAPIIVVANSADCATGDDAADAYFVVPPELDGFNLIDVGVGVGTAGTTGTMDIQVHNVDNALDMLSTKVTLGSGATYVSDGVIDASNDHVNTGDRIRIDIDAVHTIPAKGLTVFPIFRLP